MKYKCIEIGILQGFVDGELSNKHSEKVLLHLSNCEVCPVVLADLESQNDLVFAAMEAEYNVMVPTERLRSKVFASINEIESSRSSGWWTGLAGFANMLLRPGIATAAAVVMFAVLFTVGYRNFIQVDTGGPITASVNDSTPVVSPAESGDAVSSEVLETGDADDAVLDSPPPADTATRSIRTSPSRTPGASYAAARIQPEKVLRESGSGLVEITAAQPRRSANLDAEEGYLTTIATLNRTVDANKDYIMRPSERVAYERNLAVVDDAIKKMKSQVRTDPNNTAAREVLRSSYRNKIDLLNSVAERTETVASLD